MFFGERENGDSLWKTDKKMVSAISDPKNSNPKSAVAPIANAGLMLNSTTPRRSNKAPKVAALPITIIVVT
ncbi:MAG: hypothetical protein ACXAB4_04455 [Candidatus Hodarchaeales archaeon]|jgi:hypothetical protein